MSNLTYLQLLLNCQERVAARAPAYATNYRPEEMFYWSHIPYFLAYDIIHRGTSRVLDIGCAYGTLALYARLLSGGQTYCMDMRPDLLSPDLVAEYGLHFAVGNIELDDPPWDVRFDAILLTEVMEHFNFHPVPTLRRIRSLLSEQGRLYLSTPDVSRWGRHGPYPTYRIMPAADRARPIVDEHIYVYDWSELQEIFAEAGLVALAMEFSPGTDYRRHFNVVLGPA